MIVTIVIAIGVLGLLVITHELGHFLVARVGRIRVLCFSVGFGPKFARLRRGGTEYALSWIPFGGYVKMAGESPGEEEEEDIVPGSRFNEKRLGVRAAVVAAGPAMNYLLAVLIFTGFFLWVGIETIKTRVVGEVTPGSPAYVAGVRPGDELVSLAGQPVSGWEDLPSILRRLPAGTAGVTVLRDGSPSTLSVDLAAPAEGEQRLGIGPRRPPAVGGVKRGGVADRAGLKSGDLVLSVNGQPVADWDSLVETIHGAAGQELSFRWVRGGETLAASLVPELGSVAVSETETRQAGLIGISPHWDRRRLALGSAVVEGWRQTNWWSAQVVKFLGRLLRGRVTRDMVGGPLRIGELAGESYRWGWTSLLNFVAILSVHLALLNLLPIPILDGGQIFLLIPEAALRRPLSLRQRMVLQQIGFGLVILLMALVTVLDVGRFLGH